MPTIGLSAGASAAEVLVQGVIETFRETKPVGLHLLDCIKENVHLPLPSELRVI